jgi:HPt (histidine-containing phosphotransfer) domain-containing protein
MTANAMAGDRERCMAAGMDDYVAKPVRAQELVAALERCLETGSGSDIDAAADTAVTTPAIQAAPTDDGVDDSILTEISEYLGERGPAMVQELVRLFFEESGKRMDALRDGVAQSDPARLARAAHAMKGGGGNLGAIRLAGYCEKLERLGRDGSTEGAAVLVDQVIAEVARLREIFTRRATEQMAG